MKNTTEEIKVDELDEFTRGYIACAIWSSTWPDSGRPLDNDFGPHHLSQSALKSIAADCKSFQEHYGKQLDEASSDRSRHGHDFWLTRNGHGAGFWDRGYGTVGDDLTQFAKTYGSSDLYPAEGKLEIS